MRPIDVLVSRLTFAVMPKYAHDAVVPESGSEKSKKVQVQDMFDKIAFRYDFLNRFLSGRLDILWRKSLIRTISQVNPENILDVATGTGDVAIMTAKALKNARITGIDISNGMLELGRRKVAKQLLNDRITLVQGDSEAIKANMGSFDAVTVAFGVRNFEHLERGIAEIFRVLRRGGIVGILEFSRPAKGVFLSVYNFYMDTVASRLGRWLSKDREAYKYLHSSVKAFPEGETFLHILEQEGFINTSLKRLSLGICTIYYGKKPG